MFLEGLLRRKGILGLMLAVALFCGIAPSNGLAMPVNSQIGFTAGHQTMTMQKIQSFFSRTLVQKKIGKVGIKQGIGYAVCCTDG